MAKHSCDEAPPPAIGLEPVVEFAVVRDCTFSGSSGLFVDGIELGAVPHLVIARAAQDGSWLLMHCDQEWNALGVSGHQDLASAQRRAEQVYRGSSSCWRPTPHDAAARTRHRELLLEGLRCSRCRREPTEFRSLTTADDGTQLCDDCAGLGGGGPSER